MELHLKSVVYGKVPGWDGLLVQILESTVLLPNRDAPDTNRKALHAVGCGHHKILVDLEFKARSIKYWDQQTVVNNFNIIKWISG